MIEWIIRWSVANRFMVLLLSLILAGAGTEFDVTLFNCFVMGTIEDSMAGIFEALKEGALTMQLGGGYLKEEVTDEDVLEYLEESDE